VEPPWLVGAAGPGLQQAVVVLQLFHCNDQFFLRVSTTIGEAICHQVRAQLSSAPRVAVAPASALLRRVRISSGCACVGARLVAVELADISDQPLIHIVPARGTRRVRLARGEGRGVST